MFLTPFASALSSKPHCLHLNKPCVFLLSLSSYPHLEQVLEEPLSDILTTLMPFSFALYSMNCVNFRYGIFDTIRLKFLPFFFAEFLIPFRSPRTMYESVCSAFSTICLDILCRISFIVLCSLSESCFIFFRSFFLPSSERRYW